MGGFIAQEFALKYPERLDKLVLVATGFGGPNMVPVPPEAQAALVPNPDLSPEEKFRSAMPVAFGDWTWPEKHRDEYEQIVAWQLEYPQPPQAALAQIMAGATFNVVERLEQIEAPTLVVAGTEDAVVGMPDPHWGEAVWAVASLKPGEVATPEDIRQHARANLAGYKAPKRVVIVDDVPKSVAGKIVRAEARTLAETLGRVDAPEGRAPQ